MSLPRQTPSYRSVTVLGLACLTLLLASCSQPISITINLTPPTVVLILGGSVQTQVTLVRSGGATADVGLSASGLPSGVSASFAPATLAGSNLVSTLTLSATAGASVGDASVTVTASGVGLSASTQLDLSVSSLTVTGQLRGQLGEPLVGLSVAINDGTSTVSAADGSFTVGGVSVPYRLTVVNAADQWGQVFEGLTTDSPAVFPLPSIYSAPVLPSATVEGMLDAPLAVGEQAVVCLEGQTIVVNGCDQMFGGESAYSITAFWPQGGSTDVRVRAIRFEIDGDSNPVAMTGSAASAATSIVEGGTTVVDLVFGAAVSAANFTATVNAPFTATRYSAGAISHLNERFSLGLSLTSSPSNSLSFFSPFFAGATYTMIGGANDSNNAQSLVWRTGLPLGSNQAFDLHLPPALNAPAVDATGVNHATPFQVSNPGGGVVTFFFQPVVFGGPIFAVTTSATGTTIPDLAALGVLLPAATDYTWQAYSSPTIADGDAAVTGQGYLGGYLEVAIALNSGGPSPSGEGAITLSVTRGFTSQ